MRLSRISGAPALEEADLRLNLDEAVLDVTSQSERLIALFLIIVPHYSCSVHNIAQLGEYAIIFHANLCLQWSPEAQSTVGAVNNQATFS